VIGRLYTGTSGFAYSGWAPRFYPFGTAPSALLGAYAQRLGAVELHNTFYRRPTPAAVAGWVAATPAHFRFCPKAQRGASWGAFRDEDPSASVTWITDAIAGFGDRLGVVLLSLPKTTRRDDAALARFLAAWPPAVGLAVELTEPSWADDAVHARLAEHGVALVATDVDGADEPDLRRIGGALYLRLRRAAYGPDRIARWGDRLAPFLEDGLDAYVFFRHDDDGGSALHAEGLAASLERYRPAAPSRRDLRRSRRGDDPD
jgi:uncharacterized protein YecE (DUF72 family)